MNKKEFFDSIFDFINGQIPTNKFIDNVYFLYSLREIDDFTESEEEILSKLYGITRRYSEFEEDHLNYPKVYATDEEVKNAAKECYCSLLRLHHQQGEE